ncbi:HPr family phosphocarrier protein [Nocardia flavorosea]|uniref:HPr family phosphocarrier protein n=1 Tax=Nocardia flavorosea TaxID=53429 RepID=UPI001894C46A|nr:HPr family phosphocarrier protein [Nocardia flavorosea]MBF6352896.1 HPr family phosphocarrier protein [Nocardia flavorosea]
MCPNSEPAHPEITPPAAAATRAEITVTLPANLHARPAGRLVRTASRFTSAATLEYAGKSIGIGGILAVMALGATAGDTVTIAAEGPDADRAVQSLAEVLANAE